MRHLVYFVDSAADGSGAGQGRLRESCAREWPL